MRDPRAHARARPDVIAVLASCALVLCAGCVAPPPLAPIRAASASKQAASSRVSCDGPSDCTIVPRTCCGDCGAAARGDAVALNATWAAEHLPWRRCADTGCPRCHREPDPRLVATCRAHRCTLVDISRHRVTRCTDDAQCTLRAASCCECGTDDWVAIRSGREDAYARLVCGPEPVACPACVAPRPPASPRCVDGHCVLSPGGGAPGILDLLEPPG